MATLLAYAPNLVSPTVVAGPLTVEQLNAQYTSANIVGFPTAVTTDAGLQSWNGSTWISGLEYTLLQTGVPMIIPPSGNMGNNGVFTLGTALDRTYASAYMWFWTGDIASGLSGGWYYVQMTSATQGTVFNNTYRFGQPIIPSSPTAFATTGPGAWTLTINTLVTSLTCNIPAFGLGLNGRFEIEVGWTASNTSGSKAMALIYGGSSLFSDTQSDAQSNGYTTTRTVINQGQLGAQVVDGVQGAGTDLGQGFITVDSTKGQTIWAYLNVESANTDWMILHYMTVSLYSAGALDFPAPAILTSASSLIVPPGAAALGYTNNVYFINPTLAMVSTAGPTPLITVASLAHYSNATINGISYLSINQLGDGVNTACSTNTPSTLAQPLASGGMYFEAAVTLTNNSLDHWQSFYSNPIEKNGNASFPYVEIDWMEQIGGRSATDPFYGNTNGMVSWPSGSGGSSSTTNNLSSVTFFGPNVDWTKEHIVGGSYDPINKVLAYWMDGVQQPLVIDTTAVNSNLSPLHYFVVLQAASHTSGAGGVPYSMLVRYFSAWN
jgi:hypothetical protein